MSPKVSVVIPTYNRAGKVPQGIESVLGQTFTDLEVLVVDDGSSDGTDVVLREKFGDRIRYFPQTNQGASAARNKGIAESRGEWIAFLDSDDQWEPDKLAMQFQALERFGPKCGGCYTDVRFMNHPVASTMFQLAQQSYRHTEEMGVNAEALRLLIRPGGMGMVICLSSFMGRAEVLKGTGGFDLKLLYSQDSEFLFRVAMQTGFCYVNRPLVRFDRSPAELRHVGVSAEWNKLDFWLQDTQVRLEGLLRLTEGMPSEIREILHERLGGVYSGWVNWYLQSGQNGKARQAATKAVQVYPTINFVLKFLLTWISPRIALHAVRRNLKRKEDPLAII